MVDRRIARNIQLRTRRYGDRRSGSPFPGIGQTFRTNEWGTNEFELNIFHFRHAHDASRRDAGAPVCGNQILLTNS